MKIKRSIGRREEDFSTRFRNQRFQQLYTIGQTITSEMNMEALFDLIMDQTNQVMNADRSTLFLYDETSDELWSFVATGMKKNEIRIKTDTGVAGWVFQNNVHIIVNDTHKDERFNNGVDRLTGYRTKNILCVPVFNRSKKCIGSLEVLNNRSDKFVDEDAEFLKSISDYVAIAVENSKLYEAAKQHLEKIRTAMIHNEKLEKAKMLLTKFVPPSIAKMVEQAPEKLNTEKVPMDVSILFIDIQEFSRITEGQDQRLVIDMVERHFSRYLQCVHRHGGELNETAGDGLMVMFKSDTIKHHAKEAVEAGLEIIAENKRLNEELSYPWGGIHLHMGINSGNAYVGVIRMKSIAGERLTYTASGHVTVLASRIGKLSKNTQLFIGPETHAMIPDQYVCDFMGKCQLKNVSECLPIFCVKN